MEGQTLMYKACKEGKAHIVKYLMSQGCIFLKASDHNQLDSINIESCLEVSMRHRYRSILLLILKSKEYTLKEVEKGLKKYFSLLIESPTTLEIIYEHLCALSCSYLFKLWLLRRLNRLNP